MSKAYFSCVNGFVNNVRREVGEPVGALSDEEAKYLVMAGQITDEAPVKARRARGEKPETSGEETV